jgi:hypothetical protein
VSTEQKDRYTKDSKHHVCECEKMGRVVRVGGPVGNPRTLPWFHRTKTFMVWRVDSFDATDESRAVLSEEGVKTAMIGLQGGHGVRSIVVRAARSSSSSLYSRLVLKKGFQNKEDRQSTTMTRLFGLH